MYVRADFKRLYMCLMCVFKENKKTDLLKMTQLKASEGKRRNNEATRDK